MWCIYRQYTYLQATVYTTIKPFEKENLCFKKNEGLEPAGYLLPSKAYSAQVIRFHEENWLRNLLFLLQKKAPL